MAEKNKKSLHPALACVLMVLMLCCALLIGANKAWTKEKQPLQEYQKALVESLQTRVETAYNLLTVAGRYVDGADAQYAAVQADLRSMETGMTSFCCVPAQQFCTDAQALLKTLAQRADVQADGRDNMYVTQMLPQAVDMCLSSDATVAYNNVAQAFNSRMASFSGLLAKWTGVESAPLFTDMPAADETVILTKGAAYDDQ